jgi:hypothetical protein
MLRGGQAWGAPSGSHNGRWTRRRLSRSGQLLGRLGLTELLGGLSQFASCRGGGGDDRSGRAATAVSAAIAAVALLAEQAAETAEQAAALAARVAGRATTAVADVTGAGIARVAAVAAIVSVEPSAETAEEPAAPALFAATIAAAITTTAAVSAAGHRIHTLGRRGRRGRGRGRGLRCRGRSRRRGRGRSLGHIGAREPSRGHQHKSNIHDVTSKEIDFGARPRSQGPAAVHRGAPTGRAESPDCSGPDSPTSQEEAADCRTLLLCFGARLDGSLAALPESLKASTLRPFCRHLPPLPGTHSRPVSDASQKRSGRCDAYVRQGNAHGLHPVGLECLRRSKGKVARTRGSI